jgi:hypothetical protein
VWSEVEEAHRRSEHGPVSVKTLRRLRVGMIETRLALRRLRVEILETSPVGGGRHNPMGRNTLCVRSLNVCMIVYTLG